MKKTIRKEDVFDEKGYNRMLKTIKVSCKLYAFVNKITFGVFENKLLKHFEKEALITIDNFFKIQRLNSFF